MLNKVIALEGIEVIAPIGLYESEREKGNIFLVDVSVEEVFVEELDSDDIKNTFNYEELHLIVNEEMKVEGKLLENTAYRILNRIKSISNDLLKIDVIIRKKDPPLKGEVKFSKVELH